MKIKIKNNNNQNWEIRYYQPRSQSLNILYNRSSTLGTVDDLMTSGNRGQVGKKEEQPTRRQTRNATKDSRSKQATASVISGHKRDHDQTRSGQAGGKDCQVGERPAKKQTRQAAFDEDHLISEQEANELPAQSWYVCFPKFSSAKRTS